MSDERPRRRQNLESLLKFCVENTASEDPTTESSASVLDPEVLYSFVSFVPFNIIVYSVKKYKSLQKNFI
jgi:hypothetical protein